MNIDPDILTAWGGVYKKYDKHEHVFHEGELARFYYQIVEGSVKMYNSNEAGKEYLQGIFYQNQSFGEPPLFIDKPYPANAMCLQKSILIRMSLENLNKIIVEYPKLMEDFVKHFSRRIYNKSITAKEIVNNNPEFRILGFLESYKKSQAPCEEKIIIPFTRQEIANFTGLRVETVIRTLMKMQTLEKLIIRNHKLYY